MTKVYLDEYTEHMFSKEVLIKMLEIMIDQVKNDTLTKTKFELQPIHVNIEALKKDNDGKFHYKVEEVTNEYKGNS